MSTTNILDGYIDRKTLCESIPGPNGKPISPRTVQRYEDQPDGLPSLTLAGRKYYPIDGVMAWLERRTRKPNPRRKVA